MNTVNKSEMDKLPKIVAVDFDGTLVEDEYPSIGEPNKEMFRVCHQLKWSGVKLILWTSRDGNQLERAVRFCEDMGLQFDAVNENIREVQELFNNDTRKVYADLYIDDKSIPSVMSPSFWADRLGLHYTIMRGVHNAP